MDLQSAKRRLIEALLLNLGTSNENYLDWINFARREHLSVSEIGSVIRELSSEGVIVLMGSTSCKITVEGLKRVKREDLLPKLFSYGKKLERDLSANGKKLVSFEKLKDAICQILLLETLNVGKIRERLRERGILVSQQSMPNAIKHLRTEGRIKGILKDNTWYYMAIPKKR